MSKPNIDLFRKLIDIKMEQGYREGKAEQMAAALQDMDLFEELVFAELTGQPLGGPPKS